MSSPWAVAVFVAAAALSLGASAVLVVRLERVGARLDLEHEPTVLLAVAEGAQLHLPPGRPDRLTSHRDRPGPRSWRDLKQMRAAA